MSLCSGVFEEPERLELVFSNLGRSVSMPKHRHPSLLQFDFFSGFTGEIELDGKFSRISERFAFTAFPGQSHSFSVKPISRSPINFSVRLRVKDRSHDLSEAVPFSSTASGEDVSPDLARTLEQLYRLFHSSTGRSPVCIAKLTEVLTLWPSDAETAVEHGILTIGDHDALRVNAAIDYIETHLGERVTIEDLAEHLALSTRHVQRVFATAMGQSPSQYRETRRVALACDLIVEGLAFADVARRLGYQSIHSFSRWFHAAKGVTASDYRSRWTE